MLCQHHSVLGVFEGHALYGITSISALGLQSETAVKPCAEVAKSTDARDKYFMIYAEGFDPSPAHASATEAPSLEVGGAHYLVMSYRSVFLSNRGAGSSGVFGHGCHRLG